MSHGLKPGPSDSRAPSHKSKRDLASPLAEPTASCLKAVRGWNWGANLVSERAARSLPISEQSGVGLRGRGLGLQFLMRGPCGQDTS